MFTFRARAVIARSADDKRCSFTLVVWARAIPLSADDEGVGLQKAGLLQGLVATATHRTQSRAGWVLSTLAGRASLVIALSVYMTKDIVSCWHLVCAHGQ
jgi:hypothetical protein